MRRSFRWHVDEVDGFRRRWQYVDPEPDEPIMRPPMPWIVAWPLEIPLIESPWLSWENLDFSGSDYEIEAIERVVQGRKPVGIAYYITGSPREVKSPKHRAWREDAARAQSLIEQAARAKLVIDERIMSFDDSSLLHHLSVSRNSTFGQLFDLEAIARVYVAAGLAEIAAAMPALAPCWVGSRFNELAWEGIEAAATGLALGYPVESTIGFVHQGKYSSRVQEVPPFDPEADSFP